MEDIPTVVDDFPNKVNRTIVLTQPLQLALVSLEELTGFKAGKIMRRALIRGLLSDPEFGKEFAAYYSDMVERCKIAQRVLEEGSGFLTEAKEK